MSFREMRAMARAASGVDPKTLAIARCCGRRGRCDLLAAAPSMILDKIVTALVERRVFCNLSRSPPRRFQSIQENDMQRSTGCLAPCVLSNSAPARRIRRGEPLGVFEELLHRLRDRGGLLRQVASLAGRRRGGQERHRQDRGLLSQSRPVAQQGPSVEAGGRQQERRLQDDEDANGGRRRTILQGLVERPRRQAARNRPGGCFREKTADPPRGLCLAPIPPQDRGGRTASSRANFGTVREGNRHARGYPGSGAFLCGPGLGLGVGTAGTGASLRRPAAHRRN